MNDILARITVLADGSAPDPAVVAQLRSDIGKLPADVAGNLHNLLDKVILKTPAPAPGSVPKSALTGVAGLAGGAAVVAAVLSDPAKFDPSKFFQQMAIPLDSKYALLGVVAAIGAAAGLAFSVFYNNWRLVPPRFSRDPKDGAFRVDRWGFLDETAFAVGSALATTWAAIDTVTRTATPDGDKFILQGSMMLSATTAGWVGARMRVGIQDRDRLWESLAANTEKEAARPGTKAAVEAAPTVDQALRLATQAGAKPGT